MLSGSTTGQHLGESFPSEVGHPSNDSVWSSPHLESLKPPPSLPRRLLFKQASVRRFTIISIKVLQTMVIKCRWNVSSGSALDEANQMA